MKILIVEDDSATSALLSQLLLKQHYVVDVATNGETGFELAHAWEYDLIILDWLMPGLDGVSLCHRLRQKGCSQPILLLTAKMTNQDMIMGLDAGADDYVTKPFQPETLLARIRALLRRGQGQPSIPALCWGDLCLNPGSADVFYQGQPVSLTPKELMLLELFLRNPKRVFSRGAIIDRVWAMDAAPSESAVTNLIKDLRQKLKKAGLDQEMIETVYGLGYRLHPCPRIQGNMLSEPSDQGDAAVLGWVEEPSSALERTLSQFRSTLLQQVETLDAFLQQGAQGQGTRSLQHQVEELAHKLAGSLGTFGHGAASQLARAIEHTCGQSPALTPEDYAALQTKVAPIKIDMTRPPHWAAPESPIPGNAQPDINIPQVLIVHEDQGLAKTLLAEAPLWGLQCCYVPDPVQAQLHIQDRLPDALLLDLSFQASAIDGLGFLEVLRQDYPNLPILVLTGKDSLEDRIAVARLGGQAFLHHPLPIEQIFTVLVQTLAQPQSSDGSVLVVDDDPISLAIIRKVLQPWRLQVTSLQESGRFWEVLTATHPHLLILDIEMPGFSGIDLCRVVRQDPAWKDLPILVVTGHHDPITQGQVFAAGADGCLAKPIVATDLVTHVIYRIGRGHRPSALPTPVPHALFPTWPTATTSAWGYDPSGWEAEASGRVG